MGVDLFDAQNVLATNFDAISNTNNPNHHCNYLGSFFTCLPSPPRRSNICCALLLLTLEDPPARRSLVDHGSDTGDVGLAGVIVGMIGAGGRGAGGARPFLSCVDCLMVVDEREIMEGEDVGYEGARRFYGDFSRGNVVEEVRRDDSLGILNAL